LTTLAVGSGKKILQTAVLGYIFINTQFLTCIGQWEEKFKPQKAMIQLKQENPKHVGALLNIL